MTANMIPASNGQIVLKYNIRNQDSRRLLTSHLKQVILRAYKFLYRDCYRLRDEIDYLNEAVGLLSKEKDGTLLVRKESIQESIYAFFDLMEEVRAYADSSDNLRLRSPQRERKLSRALRKFINKMNSQTNVKLRSFETEILHTIDVKEEVHEFSINLRRISTPFQNLFQRNVPSSSNTSEAPTEEQNKVALLTKLSPALVTAYEETRTLLSEAGSLSNTAEDEYFIEEVARDYHAHIFENLQKVAKESTDFIQKEAVIVESLKQFNIIQLGLHKIIENSIANNMNAMKAQTDFLRNKVVGSPAFNLTPSELELEVEASVEQSQRLREELYKKHVAPRIEQNRLDYEAKITALEKEHEAQITDLQGQYESEKKYLAVKNWEYKDRIKKLEAELAQRNSFEPHRPTPTPTIRSQRESGPAATIDVAPKVIPSNLETRIQVAPPLTADRIYRL